MLAKGKSSGNICISNSMPFLPSDLSANVQKPENVVNRPIDGQTDGQTDGQKSGRGALLLGGIAMPPPPPPPPPQLGLGGKCDKKWKFKNVEKITSFSDAVTLTFDLEKLIRSGHYHYQCVYQIWEQSIPWFLSYRVNTIAGGGRLRRKTITSPSPDPSDTGDIIICKTMESIIHDKIINHMKSNKLFSPRQFGFITGRSTVLQLLHVLDIWSEILD